jgi:AraC-like DNA-binding protein
LRFAQDPDAAHTQPVSTAPTSQLSRAGKVAHLWDVACGLGPGDKPFAEAHGSYTVALVRRGAFNYRASDTNHVHTLRAGWLLLGRPGCGYECSHDHDGGDDCAALVLAPEVLDDVARATKGCRGPIFGAPVLPPVARVAALLERTRARGDADLDEIAYLVAEAVVAHAHQAPKEEIATHPTHRGRVADAIAMIEATCEAPISLAQLAARADLSPFHFLRVFRRVTGTTPHQYVIGARLRRAARLLLATSRPITEIAYDVGFEDLSNFVRTFHRAVGCSPRAYRRG